MHELSAIEKAKLRLLAIKQKNELAKASAEAAVMGASKSFHVSSLVQAGLIIDQSRPWNEMQLKAINAGLSGKSFCLIGPAGTGKTTTEKGIVASLIKNNMVPTITAAEATDRLVSGRPGLVLCSFTNMAVRQIAKHFSKDIPCMTIHKLLEFSPVYYDVVDEHGNVTGTTMRFEPTRHSGNPLPSNLKTIIVDESSMVDTELFGLLWDALPNPQAVQFIFLGDLNQLPPVYGSPILGRKLLELPVIELVEVYRQAMKSPIITLAHAIKDGKGLAVKEKIIQDAGADGRIVIHPWSTRLGAEDALEKAKSHLRGALHAGMFDPFQDMAICPYNVSFGTTELNLAAAEYLGKQRGAVVHEIVAGRDKKYLAVGDKVLVQKQEGFIKKIVRNPRYAGRRFMSVDDFVIDRHGGGIPRKKDANGSVQDGSIPNFDDPDFDVDAFMDDLHVEDLGAEARKHQGSHQLEVVLLNDHARGCTIDQILDDDYIKEHELDVLTVGSAAELNEMLFGYVVTVHKSQGSEWRNVFIYLHQSHARMVSRELLYTAITRAKEYLYLICEPDKVSTTGTITRAALNPRLKGNTLAEKLVALKELFDKQDAEESKL